MKVSASKIVADIALALEASVSQPGDAPGTPEEKDTLLGAMIKRIVPRAAAEVLLEAPAWQLCRNGKALSATIEMQENGCGSLRLPSDWLRLVAFRMSDWEQTVETPVCRDDPRYELLLHGMRGVRGSAERPICGITAGDGGGRMEFASCRSSAATPVTAIYMPRPVWDSEENMELPDALYDAVVATATDMIRQQTE